LRRSSFFNFRLPDFQILRRCFSVEKCFQKNLQRHLSTFASNMKFRLATLLLLLNLFAMSANAAWACGSEDAGHAAKFHAEPAQKICCDADDEQTSCETQDTGPNCPCDHNNGGCHCPGCGVVSHSGTAFAFETQPVLPISTLNFSAQKMAFYFADHLPEAVYLPIWQPPKIGA
jgi:hypothetical protein